MLKSKILVQVTGSIAAYKICTVVSQLVQSGCEVRVIASENSLHFIGRSTWEGLTSFPTRVNLWETGQAMDHINLVRWADLILLAPATANTINKLAAGLGDDLISTAFLAHDFKKPFLIAPAMNRTMYLHPTTQDSLKKLKDLGITILETGAGALACGETGPGRLMETSEILTQIEKSLANDTISRPSVLITAGGTSEAIDQVRSITNLSTGSTAATLAEELIRDGFNVTYLKSHSALSPSGSFSEKKFTNFLDLENLLQTELENSYDFVIHAAAVSDYSPEFHKEKISSDHESLNITLKKNPKLVNQIKTWSKNPAVKLIAFKLTATAEISLRTNAVKKLQENSKADLIIHNDVSEISSSNDAHQFTAYRGNECLFKVENKRQLAQKISQFLKEKTP